MTAPKAVHTQSCLHDFVTESSSLSSASKTSYLKALDAWIRFAGDDPTGWTTEKAQAFYDEIASKAAPATALKMLSGIRYAAKVFSTAGANPDFASGVVSIPAGTKDENKKVLTPNQVTALFEVTQGAKPSDMRDRALLAFGVGAGMRRTTLAALPFHHWSTDQGQPPVIDAMIKPSRWWRVPIPACVANMAVPYERWLKMWKIETGPFFRKIVRSVDGYHPTHPFSSDGWAIWSIVESIGSRVGLAITPDVLRQTLIVWLHSAHIEPTYITAITGQRDTEDKSIDTDYRSLYPQAAEAVDNLIRPVITL